MPTANASRPSALARGPVAAIRALRKTRPSMLAPRATWVVIAPLAWRPPAPEPTTRNQMPAPGRRPPCGGPASTSGAGGEEFKRARKRDLQRRYDRGGGDEPDRSTLLAAPPSRLGSLPKAVRRLPPRCRVGRGARVGRAQQGLEGATLALAGCTAARRVGGVSENRSSAVVATLNRPTSRVRAIGTRLGIAADPSSAVARQSRGRLAAADGARRPFARICAPAAGREASHATARVVAAGNPLARRKRLRTSIAPRV
jgi:hypothetical protein